MSKNILYPLAIFAFAASIASCHKDACKDQNCPSGKVAYAVSDNQCECVCPLQAEKGVPYGNPCESGYTFDANNCECDPIPTYTVYRLQTGNYTGIDNCIAQPTNSHVRQPDAAHIYFVPFADVVDSIAITQLSGNNFGGSGNDGTNTWSVSATLLSNTSVKVNYTLTNHGTSTSCVSTFNYK